MLNINCLLTYPYLGEHVGHIICRRVEFTKDDIWIRLEHFLGNLLVDWLKLLQRNNTSHQTTKHAPAEVETRRWTLDNFWRIFCKGMRGFTLQ